MNQLSTEIGGGNFCRRIFFRDDFLYPKIFGCGSTAVVVCEVIRSSKCGNEASKEVEADVVMWLDPKEPVKLGITWVPCKQACSGVSCLWLFRF